MTTSKGRRIYPVKKQDSGNHFWWKLEPGDYCQDEHGNWWVYPPKEGSGPGILSHEVVEHEDGTITVSPSILIHGEKAWHGFLRQGVWTEV